MFYISTYYTMPMDRQSDLEKSLQGKELVDPKKGIVEKQFSEALKGLKDKTYSKNPEDDKAIKDVVATVVDDILDEETRDGMQESIKQENIDKLNSVLLKAQDNKEMITLLYGYLTEIDELNTQYSAEIKQIISSTSTEIVTVFNSIPQADFAKTKISLEKNSTASATTTDTTVNTSSNKDNKETPKNDTTIDKGLDAKPVSVDAPKGEDKIDTTIDKDLNTKDASKEVLKDPAKTDSTIDSGITVDAGLGNEKKEKADDASANEEVKEESSKRNYAEYKDFAAEGVDEMPERARKAFRKAIEGGQLTMGTDVTDDTAIYE